MTSATHRHIRYIVHNPHEVWANCNCVHSQRGNTCKHQVKVLQMLHPHIAKGTEARFYGALKRTDKGGLHQLLTPPRSMPSTNEANNVSTLAPPSVRTPLWHPADLQSSLTDQAHELLVNITKGNDILMQHLHPDFNRSYEKMMGLLGQIKTGIIHPENSHLVFQAVDDGFGMQLGGMKDILEKMGKPSTSKRLHMGGHSTP